MGSTPSAINRGAVMAMGRPKPARLSMMAASIQACKTSSQPRSRTIPCSAAAMARMPPI